MNMPVHRDILSQIYMTLYHLAQTSWSQSARELVHCCSPNRLASLGAEKGEEWVWRRQQGTPVHQTSYSTSLRPHLEGVKGLRPLSNNGDNQALFPTSPGMLSGLRKKGEPHLCLSSSCTHFHSEVPRASKRFNQFFMIPFSPYPTL